MFHSCFIAFLALVDKKNGKWCGVSVLSFSFKSGTVLYWLVELSLKHGEEYFCLCPCCCETKSGIQCVSESCMCSSFVVIRNPGLGKAEGVEVAQRPIGQGDELTEWNWALQQF